MENNKFLQTLPKLGYDDYNKICKSNENYYVIVDDTEDLEKLFPSNLGLKMNSAIVCASASPTHQAYITMGLRLDNNKIDGHPFVVIYEKDNDNDLIISGIIEHLFHENRTTELQAHQLQLLHSCGINADIKVIQKPGKTEGTLEDLHKEGLIMGYDIAVTKANDYIKE